MVQIAKEVALLGNPNISHIAEYSDLKVLSLRRKV